ncbi:MAG: hypothetical protein ACE5OZ_23015 [Candidatus Heimdallarchaeota archaeon]
MATVAHKLFEKKIVSEKFRQAKKTNGDLKAWKDRIGLKERVKDLLERQGLKSLANFETRGESGIRYRFDFFVPGKGHNNRTEEVGSTQAIYLFSRGMGIFVKDYSGPAKVTNIIQAERAMKDCPEINKVLVISNSFSGPSANLAERAGVILLSLGEIVSTYKNEGWML